MSEFRLPEGRLEERFEESKPAYTPAEALTEANRCLYCADAPCIKACPTGIDIPTFIRKIATGNVTGAAKTILDDNILGYSCARVCPVEVLCAGDCVYNAWERPPIQIGRLQRYATETLMARYDVPPFYTAKPSTGKKVALVGAGPASIAAAALLALEGHEAVIFERKPVPGGLNTLGIAPYKMLGPDSLREIEWVTKLGDVKVRTGIEITTGETVYERLAPETLLADFDAVFLGLGLGADSRLDVPGEDGPGVYGATWLIERIKSDRSFSLDGGRALVVGAGNTAIDIAHELALLAIPDVAMVYRRGAANMSGYKHELEYARKHAVRLIEHRQPVAVERDETGRLRGLRVAATRDGRVVEGTEEVIPADLIAVAIGQNRATALAKSFDGVEVDSKGRIVVDPATHRTGNAKVWSGGDCVNGGKEVVNAVAEAKLAVRDMIRALSGT